MSKDEIKIWDMGGDCCDWIAAKNKEDALKCFDDHVGGCDWFELDDIEECNEEVMNRLQFIDDVYNPEDSQCRSFKKQLEIQLKNGDKPPFFFATSEY